MELTDQYIKSFKKLSDLCHGDIVTVVKYVPSVTELTRHHSRIPLNTHARILFIYDKCDDENKMDPLCESCATNRMSIIIKGLEEYSLIEKCCFYILGDINGKIFI